MPYPGGKGGAGVFQRLINFIPPHRVYIEPFLGGGAVLRAKRPADLSIGLDRNSAVVDTWRSGVAELREGWRRRSLATAVLQDSATIARTVETGDEGLPVKNADERSPRVVFQCADAVRFLAGYKWQGGEFVYADPPYVLSSRLGLRKRKRYGEFELSDTDHKRLLRVLLRLPCSVMVSGYASEMYSAALAGWHTFTFQAMTRGHRMATEHVWCNFAPPVELHDYSWLGDDFRERERIGRMQRRWVSRLSRMPRLQRLALQHAIAVVGGATR